MIICQQRLSVFSENTKSSLILKTDLEGLEKLGAKIELSHGYVEATCDRILIINKGKIVADGTSGDLRKKAQGKELLKVGIEGGEEANADISNLN